MAVIVLPLLLQWTCTKVADVGLPRCRTHVTTTVVILFVARHPTREHANILLSHEDHRHFGLDYHATGHAVLRRTIALRAL